MMASWVGEVKPSRGSWPLGSSWLLTLLLLMALVPPGTPLPVESRYVHSNDTMALTLSSRVSDVLRGPAGSFQRLEFTLTNTGNPGRFRIYGNSEDNFNGKVVTSATFMENGQQQLISVNDMRVPQRPVGDKVTFTLTAERLDGFSKRSAEQDPNRPQAGGNYGSQAGSAGTYMGGGGREPSYSGTGSSGSGYYSGSAGSGYYPANTHSAPNPSGGSGTYYDTGSSSSSGNHQLDPSNRLRLSLTVLFTITEMAVKDEDSGEPSVWKEYQAKSQDETCKSKGPSDPACSQEWWFVSFYAQDKFTGLNQIQVDKDTDGGRPDYPGSATAAGFYYKYQQFAVGSQDQVEIQVGATCCVDKLKLRVTDVSGNKASLDALRSEYGSGGGLSKTALWGIIGGCIAVIVIAIIVVLSIVGTKYRRVSTDPS